MDADGANPRVLDTGSPDFVPEGSPRWSPTGDRIAFTSTRTGTSQVYVVPATGGAAVQLSHESRGAFTPSWLPNGTKVVYMSVAGAAQAMSVPASGGDATVFATDSAGIGEVACGPAFCLATTDPSGSDSRIVALSATGRRASVALPRVADDHHPALLAP
jgi:dipeptidyl aminopeptidase/acylaminoacyl peptidase